MDQDMTKSKFLEQMRATRARWDELLDQIPRERMTQPAINDGWTIKDTIGHVTYYEHWVLNWLEAAVRGKVTLATHRELLKVDARNAIIFRENKDRALDEILAESRLVFDRLDYLVNLLPERDLLDPHAFERYILPFVGNSMPLWQFIADDSYAHYAEHIRSIEDWLRRAPFEHLRAVQWKDYSQPTNLP